MSVKSKKYKISKMPINADMDTVEKLLLCVTKVM